ncbi:MAG: hypothetical protein BGO25_03045 [Acidobacteriales bacterium 59-55]|nr:MAG: hypothetical protein BGO25_03045 [Acidobacteriales bacterium 59-55]
MQEHPASPCCRFTDQLEPWIVTPVLDALTTITFVERYLRHQLTDGVWSRIIGVRIPAFASPFGEQMSQVVMRFEEQLFKVEAAIKSLGACLFQLRCPPRHGQSPRKPLDERLEGGPVGLSIGEEIDTLLEHLHPRRRRSCCKLHLRDRFIKQMAGL